MIIIGLIVVTEQFFSSSFLPMTFYLKTMKSELFLEDAYADHWPYQVKQFSFFYSINFNDLPLQSPPFNYLHMATNNFPYKTWSVLNKCCWEVAWPMMRIMGWEKTTKKQISAIPVTVLLHKHYYNISVHLFLLHFCRPSGHMTRDHCITDTAFIQVFLSC